MTIASSGSHPIGVIADTHGLLRSEAIRALKGSSLIIHAGDVGDSSVLDGLRAIARVVAIRGNVDTAAWTSALRPREVVKVAGAKFYVIHDAGELDVDPAAEGFDVVISGHSHRPSIDARGGVLYVNPGSAGPRRFSLPVTVARLTVRRRAVTGRIVALLPQRS